MTRARTRTEDWPHLDTSAGAAESTTWNVTVVAGTLDRPIDAETARAVAERVHGEHLLDVLVDGAHFGVAGRSLLSVYPALEQAGEVFVDALAEAGYTLRHWDRVEWLAGVRPGR
ncbi:hypothetical protein [Amycolatopsis sp. YIM 10]|uniref:hypothetical protein n=1 Tax=Amycolatopsis sp. YIM 10 TaxID=2653857 RepID=UPI001290268F|nr:hypothetical protein [Amycolatopsis sp. YIM 10]QFU94324.1 hypothetical protein YIM_45985 [Amycolatopsis sp. YIM 10]